MPVWPPLESFPPLFCVNGLFMNGIRSILNLATKIRLKFANSRESDDTSYTYYFGYVCSRALVAL